MATAYENPVTTSLSSLHGLPESYKTLRILVAEDNAVNRHFVKRLLEKRGHIVLVANDGREALNVLEINKWSGIDVVLMDVQMPEMDGLAATAAIRAREKLTGTHLPVIALTAHVMAGDREQCLAAGMDGYLTKPIEITQLFEALEMLVPSGVGVRVPAK